LPYIGKDESCYWGKWVDGPRRVWYVCIDNEINEFSIPYEIVVILDGIAVYWKR